MADARDLARIYVAIFGERPDGGDGILMRVARIESEIKLIDELTANVRELVTSVNELDVPALNEHLEQTRAMRDHPTLVPDLIRHIVDDRRHAESRKRAVAYLAGRFGLLFFAVLQAVLLIYLIAIVTRAVPIPGVR